MSGCQRAGTALLLTVAMALSGCSGSSDPSSGGSPGGQSTAKGLTLAGTWPLTRLPAPGGPPPHPGMGVQIDQTESSKPQNRLSQAGPGTQELLQGRGTPPAA